MGLSYSLRFAMARQVETKTTFQQAEIARRLEHIRRQERDDRKAKKPRRTGGFGSSYSRGKVCRGRGYLSRLG